MLSLTVAYDVTRKEQDANSTGVTRNKVLTVLVLTGTRG